MQYKKVNKIFCQPLLSNKLYAPPLSEDEERYIWEKSRDNLYSGFINESIIFDRRNVNLQTKLQKLSKNYKYKFFSMYEDMYEINNKFKENNIKAIFLKGMALNLAEIQSPQQRHCRDIDILVEKDNLAKAYNILKSIGFSYLEKDCEDVVAYLGPKHHLPQISNNKGVIVELHHRITSPQAYTQCPLTSNFLENFQLVKDINIPSPANLILHAIYHGMVHNSQGDGLLFLIDLKKILSKYDISIDIEQVETLLKIDRKALTAIRDILSEASKGDARPDNVQNLIEHFFESEILFCEKRKRNLGKKLGIIKKLNIIKYQYQTRFLSIKFLRIITNKIIGLVKEK